ncbi:MAG TPA: cytochrome c [Anaerolineae bacterium]|nr:cytochrome c [Anaerolineae bacterium]
MAKIERVEVYVDGSPEPLQVITQAPFKVKLSPSDFEEGDHHMRVVTYYDNGEYYDQPYLFTIDHTGEVEVAHINRAPIFSEVEIALVDPMEQEGMPPPKLFTHAVLPVLLFLLILLVAGWFSIYGDSAVSDVVTNIEPIAEASQPEGAMPEGGAVDGAAIYAENCATCHGPNGEGQGDVFPALAGNANLADTEMVIDTVLHGRQGTAMPPWGNQFNDEQIAAVINHVLSSWGNSFGSVTPEDVAAKR